MFRLLRVDEVELVVSVASTMGNWTYTSGDITYTLGLDHPINEGANCASAVRTMSKGSCRRTQTVAYISSVALAWFAGLPCAATCFSYALEAWRTCSDIAGKR
jgi:hypothetical protein